MWSPVQGTGRRQTGCGCREVKELVKAIKRAGGTVRACDNHLKVYLGDTLIATMSSTPSDYRTIKNTIADLRRAGLPLTSKGRLTHG